MQRWWKLLLLLAILVLLGDTGLAQISMSGGGGGGTSMTITEIDGAPSGTFSTLKFSNGSVTNNGDGSATIMTGGGGGGDVSSNTATSVIGELAIFGTTGGKTIGRATGTGLAKVMAGVLSTATAGADYVVPAGNVATATGLAADGTNCAAGQIPLGIDASGNAQGCYTLTTVATATALAADGGN